MTKTTKTTKAKAAAKPTSADVQPPADEPTVQPASEPSPAAPATRPEPRQTKVQAVVALLQRPEGARIQDIMTTTGWQAHSVRGAMSGAIKKGLGLSITSEKVGGVRVYRIAEAGA
jgi:hypothetical protein